MSNTQGERFPRGALIGAAGLIGLSLIAAGTARLEGTQTQVPASSPVVVRDLRFEDTPDGAVNVYEGRSERPVNVVTPGADAFLRATMRGLAQQRKRHVPGVVLRTGGCLDIRHRSEVAAIAGLADRNPAWRFPGTPKLEMTYVGHPVRLVGDDHLLRLDNEDEGDEALSGLAA